MTEQMTLSDFGMALDNKTWEYDEDTGNMMCRCPDCECRMPIYKWTYWNPYRYCPYCGIWLHEGNFAKRYCQIYDADEETVRRVRREYGKE